MWLSSTLPTTMSTVKVNDFPRTPAKQISKPSGLLTPPSSVPQTNRISPDSTSESQPYTPSPASRQLQRETREWSGLTFPISQSVPLQNPNFNIAAQPAEVESPMVKSFGITQEDVGVESGAIINGAGFEAQPGLEAERNNGKGDLEMLEPEFKMLLEGMQEEDWLVREDQISGASPAPPPVVPSTLEHHPVSNDGQLP